MLELKNKKDTGIHKKGRSKNDSESGKSMVEMLGVLALMGLLAILGAKGYNMAMERAMANEIINDVNKRSLLHSQQAGSALDVSEMPDKIRDIYPVSAEKLGVQFFTLKVSQVETPVCRRIADLGYTVPIQVTANGTKITSDNTTPCENQAGIVEMAFTFNRTLTPCPGCLDQITPCLNNSSCQEGYLCQAGQCICQSPCGTSGCCLSGQVCSNNKCVQPGCVSDEDCENGSCLGGQCGCQSFRDCSPNRYCVLSEGWNGGGIGRCSSSSDVSGSEGGYIWSAKKMFWYTADDFCKSHGMELVDTSGWDCDTTAWSAICSNTNLPDGIGTHWYWTKHIYESRTFWAMQRYNASTKEFGFRKEHYSNNSGAIGPTGALCY